MGMHLEADKCLQCFECTAGVIYLTSGLLSSPRKEGLKRDNRAVKVLMTAWAVEKDFAGRSSVLVQAEMGLRSGYINKYI